MEEIGKFVLYKRRYSGELRVVETPYEYVQFSRLDKNGFHVRGWTHDINRAKLFPRNEAERALNTPSGSRYVMKNFARHLIEEALDS